MEFQTQPLAPVKGYHDLRASLPSNINSQPTYPRISPSGVEQRSGIKSFTWLSGIAKGKNA